jgi:ribosomal protein L35AE/L33A
MTRGDKTSGSDGYRAFTLNFSRSYVIAFSLSHPLYSNLQQLTNLILVALNDVVIPDNAQSLVSNVTQFYATTASGNRIRLRIVDDYYVVGD